MKHPNPTLLLELVIHGIVTNYTLLLYISSPVFLFMFRLKIDVN